MTFPTPLIINEVGHRCETCDGAANRAVSTTDGLHYYCDEHYESGYRQAITPLSCSWPAGVTGGGSLIPCRKEWGHEGKCEPL